MPGALPPRYTRRDNRGEMMVVLVLAGAWNAP